MSLFNQVVRLACIVCFVVLFSAVRADTVKFTLHKATDTNNAHHVAFTYLIPKSWTVTDNIVWNLMQRSAPMQFSFSTASEDKRFALSFLNTRVFDYTLRGGKGDQGKAPPEHPTDVIIDNFKSAHPGVEVNVLERLETPATSKFKAIVITSRALRCSVKLRFEQDGVPMLMKAGFDFDGYEVGTTWGRAHGFSNGVWTMSNLTYIRGPETEFPKAMKLAAVSLSSRQWDPQFFQQYQEVCHMLVQQMQHENQIRLDAEFKRMQQQYHDLSRSNMVEFNAQQAAKDKNTRTFCDYVLDQSRYSDGHTTFILPSGYNRAATNGSDYLLTNDASYSAGGNWHELKKVN